jgi:sugar lactone lactonase YvrE
MVEPNSRGSDTATKRAIGICFAIVLASCAARLFGQAGSEIIRLDPKLDEIVSSDAGVEKLAGGFGFVEGPVWDRRGGYLLFSDIPANVINKWTPDGKVSVLVKPSGFKGTDPSDVGSQNNNGKEVVTLIGSNGLTLDRQGRIVLAAHGDRAIVRIEKSGQRTVLADKYEGKRFNSPNDLVYKLVSDSLEDCRNTTMTDSEVTAEDSSGAAGRRSAGPSATGRRLVPYRRSPSEVLYGSPGSGGVVLGDRRWWVACSYA